MRKLVTLSFIHLLLLTSLVNLSGCLDSGRAGYPSVDKFGSSDTPGDDTGDDTDANTKVRPTGVISVENYCICQQGKPVVINNCETECATRPSTNSPKLYVTVALGAEITGNSELKDLKGWCETAYGDDNQAPSCSVKIYDEYYTPQTLQLESLTAETNSFVVDLSAGNIQYDRRYKFQLIEIQSGATSLMEGFKMEEIDTSDNGVRPLRLDIINLYSCVARAGEIADGLNYYKSAVKMNYFYAASDPPDAMPPNEQFVLCHDPYADGQGDDDNFRYPRLFLKKGIFALWNRSDGLFTADTTDSSQLAINVLVKKEVANLGGTLKGTIFGPFKWPTAPAATSSDSDNSSASNSSITSSTSNVSSGTSSELPTIGYYMQPWVDANDIPYCPNNTHYENSGDPLFQVLSKFIDETEAIYMAKREAKTIIVDGEEKTAPIDVLLIRENVLNKIWFYQDINTGQDKRADYEIARQQTVMFYWPPNFNAPLQPNTNSDLYWIRFPEDIGDNATSTATGDLPQKKPADKRFGCIPKSNDVILPTSSY